MNGSIVLCVNVRGDFLKHYKKDKYYKKIDYTRPTLSNPDYVAYTDGACWHEKYDTSIGRGGYGTIIIKTGSNDLKGREYSEGYVLTTNNRMELMAVIVALHNVPKESKVRVYSDSQYVIKILRGDNRIHTNEDLWQKYYELVDEKGLHVDPVWLKGHNGNVNNERCDRLAKSACCKEDLLNDEWYEKQQKSYVLESEMDLPQKYYEKNAQIVTREVLIHCNHVNPLCADAILRFWECSNPMEDEFAQLKTNGKDYWSDYKYEWFEKNCDKEILGILEKEFSDVSIRESCLRWYMRGLSLADAIKKAAYDFERFKIKR